MGEETSKEGQNNGSTSAPALAGERSDGSALSISQRPHTPSSRPAVTHEKVGPLSTLFPMGSENDLKGELNSVRLVTAWETASEVNGECLLWVIMKRIILDTDVNVVDCMGDTLKILVDVNNLQATDKDKFLSKLYDSLMAWLLTAFQASEPYSTQRISLMRGNFAILQTCRTILDYTMHLCFWTLL